MISTYLTASDAIRLDELAAFQSFLEDRQKAFVKNQEVFEKAVNDSIADYPPRARKRLVTFMAQFGYVVLEAHGSSNNASLENKKGWQDTIATIIARNPETLLPVMTRLYDGFHKKEIVTLPVDNPEMGNHVRNLLRELGKVGIVNTDSSIPEAEEFLVTFVPRVLNPAKKDAEAKANNLWLRSGWAEKAFLYLAEKTIREFAKKRKLPHDFYWNVKVSNREPFEQPNTEFDILAYVGDRWYVFESKAGRNLSVVRWVDRWHLFGEDSPDRKATIIQCAIQNFPTEAFSPLHLFPLTSFETSLRTLLETDFPQTIT